MMIRDDDVIMLCVCVYTHIHACVHAYVRAYVHAYVCVCVCVARQTHVTHQTVIAELLYN